MRSKAIRVLQMTMLCWILLSLGALAAEEELSRTGNDVTVLAISAAVSVGLGCIAAGYAVGRVGSAAMGAAAERPEVLGRALLFVALGEGIAIMGFGIAFLLWLKI